MSLRSNIQWSFCYCFFLSTPTIAVPPLILFSILAKSHSPQTQPSFTASRLEIPSNCGKCQACQHPFVLIQYHFAMRDHVMVRSSSSPTLASCYVCSPSMNLVTSSSPDAKTLRRPSLRRIGTAVSCSMILWGFRECYASGFPFSGCLSRSDFRLDVEYRGKVKEVFLS